jgi:hypothetical protein
MNNESQLSIDHCGTKIWKTKEGKLHRLDGPAVEYEDGGKEWFQNGKRHRLDGPAVECIYGKKKWFKNGKLFKNKDDFLESLTDEEKSMALFSKDFFNE